MGNLIDPRSFSWAGGIEDTFIPQALPGMRPLEEYELTQHYDQWRSDLDRAASLGISKLRWGVPWYRVESQPGVFDWSWIDEVLDYMINKLRITPIIDLVHYGTPLWMKDSFVDATYSDRVALYAGEFARRYSHMVRYYTPLNEPTVNGEFSGRKALWPPYLQGEDGYVRVMLNIALGIQKTVKAIRAVDPDAIMVAVESMHLFRPMAKAAREEAHISFLKDLLCWDLTRGAVDRRHKLYDWLTEHGADECTLAGLVQNGVEQDVFGVNYYPWSSEDLLVDDAGKIYRVRGPDSGRYLADVLRQVHKYVGKPLFITETSSPGDVTRRALWMSETIDAVRLVRSQGVPVIGYTWFPIITMINWEYRTTTTPIAEHLLHLGLWDCEFSEDGTLVRHETRLIADFQDWIDRGMEPIGCKPCMAQKSIWRQILTALGAVFRFSKSK
jgi:beta-glucosidase/6-phospho-beta-glucosidase/beta-galactosidase